MSRLSNSGTDLRAFMGELEAIGELTEISAEENGPALLIDACRPYRWMDEFPEVNCFPREVKEIRKKWNF